MITTSGELQQFVTESVLCCGSLSLKVLCCSSLPLKVLCCSSLSLEVSVPRRCQLLPAPTMPACAQALHSPHHL